MNVFTYYVGVCVCGWRGKGDEKAKIHCMTWTMPLC
jgi:hypothetical protein